MYLFLITLIFGSMYVYFSLTNHKNSEGFDTKYKNRKDNMNHEDFYTFLLDELFFDKEYYENFCKVLLQDIGTVYNKHLCIGVKHGGHVNELLRENVETITISKSKPIILFCEYNYPSHTYKHVDNYDTNSYIFDENAFTMISLIDCEVYCDNAMYGLFYNISKWITNKGLVYIDVYDTVEQLKVGIQTTNSENYVEKNYSYRNKIETIDENRFFLNETIKQGNNKKNIKKEYNYHSVEKLLYVAQECGLTEVERLKHHHDKFSGRGIIVLQRK